MAELGDISGLMVEGSGAGPANLKWLEVDEQQYRELDQLPKQNLDVVPDLVAQWSHEDRSPQAYFVPNRDMAGYPVDPRVPQAPTTMGDLSQVHGPLQPEESAVLEKTARLTLMQHQNIKRWMEVLSSRFSKDTLRANRTVLGSILSEFGLLGHFYIDAADFPKCAASAAKSTAAFVRRFASEAHFVKRKEACGNCCHKTQAGSTSHCSVFHKQLVMDVPYTDAMATQVEGEQAARGHHIAKEGSARDRIRMAYLGQSSSKSTFSGQTNTAAIIPVERLFRKQAVMAPEAVQAAKARPVTALVRRELLKGRTATEVAKALRLAFAPNDLKATQEQWLPLYREAGLYGSVYSTQDSFDDCREGADFLSRHSSKVRGIVAGAKCGSCIYNQAQRCMMYGRKLVAQAEDLYTPQTVSAVLDEYKIAGKISSVAAAQPWGSSPKEALQNIHRASSADDLPQEAFRMGGQSGFYGGTSSHTSSTLTRRSILKQASKYMNEGLYGQDLSIALRSQFDPRDLVAAATDLKQVLSEQGLQGIYYIDPTIYDDYGRGCKEAQRLHRSRQAVRYAKVGDKCGSCVHHTQPGLCSVLAKELVQEPPYQDKQAQQQAILDTGRATEVSYDSLINNGLTMMQEYDLRYGSREIELHAASIPMEVSIQFGTNDVDLTKL